LKKIYKNWKFVIFPIVIILIICLGILLFSDSKSDSKNEGQLQTIVINAKKNHSSTVIFLHGMGDNAKTYKKIFEPLSELNPNLKIIFPQAPKIPIGAYLNSPKTAWYNMEGDPHDILTLREDKVGLLNTLAKIKDIVQKEINSGIPAEKISIIGHSQGGAVALALGLVSEHPLGGIIGLSSFMPCRNEIFNLAKKENKQVPFFLFHSNDDNVIPTSICEKSFQLLQGNGYKAQFKGDFHGGHYFFNVKTEAKKIFNLIFTS